MLLSLSLASIAFSVIAQAGSPAAGPVPSAPISITASVGRGTTWEDEGSVGSGTSAGAGVEWRVRPKWAVGAEVERLSHSRETPGLTFSGRTIFVSASVAYHFTAPGVSPYAGGGFGGSFYKGQRIDRLTPQVSPLTLSSASTMGYGMAGVEIPVGDRFAISPEFRMTLAQPRDDFATWSTIRFGVKGAVRF